MKGTLKAPQPKQSCDPFAPPDWRWRYANDIVKDVKRAHEFTDSHVLAAVDHLNAAKARRSRGFNLAIGEAAGIYRDDDLTRAEVEARIVAGEADSEIALAIKSTEEVLLYYRSLFFEVPPNACDYILIKVVGPGHRRGFRDHEVRKFWIWAAMRQWGPIYLNLLLTSFRKAHLPGKPPKLSDYLCRNNKVHPDIQRMVAAAVLPQFGEWSNWFAAEFKELAGTHGKADSVTLVVQREIHRRKLIKAGRAWLAGDVEPPKISQPKEKRQRGERASTTQPLVANQTTNQDSLHARLTELIRCL